MPDMILLDRVCHRYADGEPDIFREVSFTLAKGEMVFLTGASGSGKSTLLKLIARLTKPTVGKIIVGGLDLATLKTRQVPAYRRQFGMIFQNFNLLPERTVYDNVAMPLIIRGYSGEDIGRRVRAALDAVGLRGKEKAYPATLSGGEQQRAGIARSVVAKPQLLLADEPTGNLDPDTSREIMELFMRFNEVGVSVLVATHALGLIRRLPYRIVQIHEGLLMEAGGVPSPASVPRVNA